MEVTAGIPSVIFGLWGALTFGPLLAKDVISDYCIKSIGSFIPFFRGDYMNAMSMLTASIVLAMMVVPIIMTLSFDSMMAVPHDLTEGSLSLGASKWQSIYQDYVKKGKVGIFGSIILALGRAIGETMAVLMIMSFSPALPSSIFNGGGTMTSAIAATFTGSFANPDAREGLFSIALLLLIFVLIINILFLFVTKDRSWNGFGPIKRLNKLKMVLKRSHKTNRTMMNP